MIQKLTHKSHTERAILALISLTASFALLGVLARYLNDGFSIFQQVYLRVGVALLLATFVFKKYIRWTRLLHMPRRDMVVLVFRGVAMYLVGVVLISAAVNTTLIGNVSFISALPFVPLLGFFLLGERVTLWKILFISGSLLGVSLIAVHDFSNLFSWGRGEVLAILSNLGFALGYISRRWHTDQLNNHEITWLTFLVGAVAVLLASMITAEGLPSQGWTVPLALGLLVGGALNVVNLLASNYSFEHIDAVRAGNLLTLEVVFGLLFGFLFYREFPSWRGLVGGALITICVVGMNLYSGRDQKAIVVLEPATAISTEPTHK